MGAAAQPEQGSGTGKACVCDRTLQKTPLWSSPLPTTTSPPPVCSTKTLQTAQQVPCPPEPAGPLHPHPPFLQTPTHQETLPVPSHPSSHPHGATTPPVPVAPPPLGFTACACKAKGGDGSRVASHPLLHQHLPKDHECSGLSKGHQEPSS